MSTTVLQIDGLGPVEVAVARSSRAKRVSVTIKPDQTVSLTVPRRRALAEAHEFLQSKIPWIAKHLQRLRRSAQAPGGAQPAQIDKAKAETFLKARLQQLAARHNFGCAKVTIRNQKTKWGSCSAKNNISLNVNLARLPADLRDYVILHELLHTRIKNHSQKFWREMDRLLGDGKGKQKRLKECGLHPIIDCG
ncbi:MAG: M48 family metallopeptidase [Phycisphaerales bacterium]|nr:MAG: M48 family metallopeptidase [Phycisphaerales bacterium]